MNGDFDKLVMELLQSDGNAMVDGSMTMDPDLVSKIPVRYRIIALGFVRHLSVDDVNDKLKQAGCEILYARNIWEASLIYAFASDCGYEEWCKLREWITTNITEPEDDCFNGKQITYRDMEQYLREHSLQKEEVLITRHITRKVANDIRALSGNLQDFLLFLRENVREFGHVREKSRYYFCKYLKAYLDSCILWYVSDRSKKTSAEIVEKNLEPFLGISSLFRKRYTAEESVSFLKNAAISCRGIFDNFNDFYLGYISTDWLEVLLDDSGALTNPSSEKRGRILGALRKSHPKWKKLSDREVIQQQEQLVLEREKNLDEIYSLQSKNRGLQRNRSGENSIRKYIKGLADIDRVTLISYLLFFNSGIHEEDRLYLSVKRLNDILAECGFPALRRENEFDQFVSRYLQTSDKLGCLIQYVTQMADNERNSFLYHIYTRTVNNDQQIKTIMGM